MEKKSGTGKFIIEIEQSEHATWQGTVLWADRNLSQKFRSTLELIKLMDQALKMQN